METGLSSEQITAMVMKARAAYGRNEAPHITLADTTVNALATQAQQGDEMARELVLYWGNRFISPHLRRIHWVKYADVGPEDMWQEGRLLLLTAIDKYDQAKGYAFGAYAARIVANALGEWAESHSLAIPAARSARRRLRKEGVVDATTAAAKMAENLPRYLSTILSAGDDHEGQEDFLSDLLPERPDPFDLEDAIMSAELIRNVRDAFLSLEPTFRDVLYARYVIPMSVERAHKHLHMSMGGLRAVEQEALSALKERLKDYSDV
jgi:RNA polymerase sigma factor (sigma-70 family)